MGGDKFQGRFLEFWPEVVFIPSQNPRRSELFVFVCHLLLFVVCALGRGSVSRPDFLSVS